MEPSGRPNGARSARIVVVGLGPAGPELVSEDTKAVVDACDLCFLRTTQHPAAAGLGDLASFDHHYQSAGSFQEVYRAIVEDLVAVARGADPRTAVAYVVPGSPLVAEHSVALLRRRSDLDVEVHPALSFLDLAWARLGVDPVAGGVRLVDATTFAASAAGSTGPLLVAQCWSQGVLSEMKLAVEGERDQDLQAIVLHHLGLEDEQVLEVPWHRLDQVVDADHLTSVWIPRLADPIGAELVGLDELTRTLRRECPWDREQTHRSLRPHLLEEAYEVLDAIDELDRLGMARTMAPSPQGETAMAAAVSDSHGPEAAAAIEHLAEELGDLLFQVVIHSRLASEEGWFTLADVASGIAEKLVARHPHVFGDAKVDSAQAVAANWEALKAAEKRRSSVLQGIPHSLPSLALSSELVDKAQRVGVTDHLAERLAATLLALASSGPQGADDDPQGWPGDPEGQVGRLLFSASLVARAAGVDAELALRRTARQFAARVEAGERLVEPGSPRSGGSKAPPMG